VRIRLRLALLFAAGTALLVGVGGLVFLHQLHRGLIRSLDSALRTRADSLIQAIPDESDGVNLRDPATRTSSSSGQALREVIRADGKVVDASDTLGGRRLLRTSDLARARRGAFAVSSTNEAAAVERTRLLAVPFPHRGETWVAVVGASLEGTDNAIQRVRNAVVFGGPPIVLLSGVAAWLLAAGPWSWALFPRRIVPGVPVRGRSVALAMAPRARGRWWVRGASAQRRACAQRGTRWRGVPG